MAWTVPTDFSTGRLVTASDWNAELGSTGNMAQTAAAKATTAGDTVYATAANTLARLAIGAANTVLTSSGSAPQWSSSLSLGGSLTTAGALTVNATGSVFSAGTDADTVLAVGSGGGAPTANRIGYLRNGTTVWYTLVDKTVSGAKGTDTDFAWYSGPAADYVAALNTSGRF